MDLSIYHKDFTQHDVFGLLPGAAGGRAPRDNDGRVYLVTIATKGGRTTLERYGRDYMKELASRGGKAKRRQEVNPAAQRHPLGWHARAACPVSSKGQQKTPAAYHPLLFERAGLAGLACSYDPLIRFCMHYTMTDVAAPLDAAA